MRTMPPSGTSTRPAALARLRAKSTVMGCSPTRPLTPSVPKYFRVKEASSCYIFGSAPCLQKDFGGGRSNLAVLQGRHHLQGVYGGGYVMDTKDTRAIERCN